MAQRTSSTNVDVSSTTTQHVAGSSVNTAVIGDVPFAFHTDTPIAGAGTGTVIHITLRDLLPSTNLNSTDRIFNVTVESTARPAPLRLPTPIPSQSVSTPQSQRTNPPLTFTLTQIPATKASLKSSVPAIPATQGTPIRNQGTSTQDVSTIPVAAVTHSSPVIPQSNSTSQSHDSTSSSPSVPIGVLIGAVLAAVVLTGAALCIYYFRVLRRRQVRVGRSAQPMTTSTRNFVSSLLCLPRQVETAAENPAANTDSTPPIWPQQQHGSPFTKGDQINPAAATFTYTTLTSTAPQSVDLVSTERGNRSFGRRAVDAGPVFANADADEEEEDDGASTLPPGYRDIFGISRSSTVSSRR